MCSKKLRVEIQCNEQDIRELAQILHFCGSDSSFLWTVTSSHFQYYSIFCPVRVFKRMIIGSVHQKASDSYLIIEIRASTSLFDIHSVCSHLRSHTSV
jgi:hypothetical protein